MHAFGLKFAIFRRFVFLSYIGQENVFYDILERKNAFLGYKNNKFKMSQNWHFSKGVTPCFWSIIGYFSTFCFLANIGQWNVFYSILKRKNAFLGNKSKKFKKAKNWHFSEGVSPCFWPKICHYFSFIFFGNIDQEKVFYNLLERKNAFLGYKNKKFKESKNWHFSKGVSLCFWSKIGHFLSFCFLGNICQENVFYDILERKNAFLGYKNNKFKKSKNWHFSKGVSLCFWSKICHFSTFCF